MLAGFGLDTHVYSIDVARVSCVSHPKVTFWNGSGQALGDVLSEEFLASIPRPLLVIEDADHSNETTTAVLNFFHDRLHDGERIIVEDVMTANGAALGLKAFLEAHAEEYLIDQRYCDFFGTNATWCVNGWLKRVRPVGAGKPNQIRT
jgi:cephalosporin hydroxylase